MTVFAVEYVYAADSAAVLDEVRPAHRAWLSGLESEGKLLTSGPYGDGAGALLIFKTSDEAALTELLKQDPFATAGTIAGIRTMEWKPVIGLLAAHAS
ncbi:YciI family protein [Pseudarthrobacter sp. J75]|uniref:YciI family protein n=1 Tax=unclassified Pseudarthrobacter TaxID=2647000 RepID=UPI002E814FF8|nr:MULTISPECIES: YciI family protein [unclassified Pseudarthrobacter]MEE2521789.1 YciI family protein [Pseudarthrobacter sp. J47]MEE2527866.1 YciI family protein [Pseudarthrobacter sp. J75]MEE2569435.1 YciI family protein [Pseudarthrobacter sp. J64]